MDKCRITVLIYSQEKQKVCFTPLLIVRQQDTIELLVRKALGVYARLAQCPANEIDLIAIQIVNAGVVAIVTEVHEKVIDVLGKEASLTVVVRDALELISGPLVTDAPTRLTNPLTIQCSSPVTTLRLDETTNTPNGVSSHLNSSPRSKKQRKRDRQSKRRINNVQSKSENTPTRENSGHKQKDKSRKSQHSSDPRASTSKRKLSVTKCADNATPDSARFLAQINSEEHLNDEAQDGFEFTKKRQKLSPMTYSNAVPVSRLEANDSKEEAIEGPLSPANGQLVLETDSKGPLPDKTALTTETSAEDANSSPEVNIVTDEIPEINNVVPPAQPDARSQADRINENSLSIEEPNAEANADLLTQETLPLTNRNLLQFTDSAFTNLPAAVSVRSSSVHSSLLQGGQEVRVPEHGKPDTLVDDDKTQIVLDSQPSARTYLQAESFRDFEDVRVDTNGTLENLHDTEDMMNKGLESGEDTDLADWLSDEGETFESRSHLSPDVTTDPEIDPILPTLPVHQEFDPLEQASDSSSLKSGKARSTVNGEMSSDSSSESSVQNTTIAKSPNNVPPQFQDFEQFSQPGSLAGTTSDLGLENDSSQANGEIIRTSQVSVPPVSRYQARSKFFKLSDLHEQQYLARDDLSQIHRPTSRAKEVVPPTAKVEDTADEYDAESDSSVSTKDSDEPDSDSNLPVEKRAKVVKKSSTKNRQSEGARALAQYF